MNDRKAEYWQRNLRYLGILLSVWFLVSYGFGILLADMLDSIRLGGFKLGFWFAQQGSIYVFVILIFVYVRLMNKLDREFNVHEEESPEPAFVSRTPAQAVEQEKEEELIIEEKDADEAVQPPKAEEIMILPPEEADTAFSEMGMIYFAYDKSEITAEFEEVIQKNYEWIFQNPDAQVQLEGHCDERGTNEYNLALGERRAKAVFDYLVSLGASPSQFTILSFGEERPVAYGSNEASWRQNRRVEFTQL